MPGDTRPHVARKAKKARRAGSVDDARALLWRAMQAAETVLNDAVECPLGLNSTYVLKAVHAITQATAAYARIVEAGELEARLSELEAAFNAKDDAQNTLRKVA